MYSLLEIEKVFRVKIEITREIQRSKKEWGG